MGNLVDGGVKWATWKILAAGDLGDFLESRRAFCFKLGFASLTTQTSLFLGWSLRVGRLGILHNAVE